MKKSLIALLTALPAASCSVVPLESSQDLHRQILSNPEHVHQSLGTQQSGIIVETTENVYKAEAIKYKNGKTELRIHVTDKTNNFDYVIRDFNLDGDIESTAIWMPTKSGGKSSVYVESNSHYQNIFTEKYKKALDEIPSLLKQGKVKVVPYEFVEKP